MPFADRTSRIRLRELAVGLAALALSTGAFAHKSSDAYLEFIASPGQLHLRWDIALRDLEVVLDMDTNADGKLSWGEVKAALPRIDSYAQAHLQVAGCDLTPKGTSLEHRNDGTYIALKFDASCEFTSGGAIRYSLFAEVDPTHRGIARVLHGEQETELIVLDPMLSNPGSSMANASSKDGQSPPPASRTVTGLQFVKEGVHHILTGYDHILFLLCLLLPAVATRADRNWQPVLSLRAALMPILGIVSAFTLAHSVTLALSALKIVTLPSGRIEPAIALTIMLAAADNLFPIFPVRRVVVTFLFGLIHGFGFASVLSEVNLRIGQFVLALLEFNVGLEIGQFLIVLVAAVLLYRLRTWRGYGRVVIGFGSSAALVLAALWFIERVANISLLPFKV